VTIVGRHKKITFLKGVDISSLIKEVKANRRIFFAFYLHDGLVDAEGAHEVGMLKEDLVVHDVVEAALHYFLFVRGHLHTQQTAHGTQVPQQGDDVFNALLADYVRLLETLCDLHIQAGGFVYLFSKYQFLRVLIFYSAILLSTTSVKYR
jgi:hypothetical protein